MLCAAQFTNAMPVAVRVLLCSALGVPPLPGCSFAHAHALQAYASIMLASGLRSQLTITFTVLPHTQAFLFAVGSRYLYQTVGKV